MIEFFQNWAAIIISITVFLTAFIGLLDAFEKLKKKVPTSVAKFIASSITLGVPNLIIIWYFFYLAGLSFNRLSEPFFFWAMVAQPTVGVTIYGCVWVKKIYPRLQNKIPQISQSREVSKRKSHKRGISQRKGAK